MLNKYNVRLIILMALLVVFTLLACKKNDITFTKDKISGVSQKGPFLNGSSLTIFELDNAFAQTGKSYNTQINDNLGSFELNNISLTTQYAKLKADGYYYNEVTNDNSIGSISLYAMSDLSNKSTVNVNLLSTLEASRVSYLIENGASFNDAKHQAQQEVLKMFFIQKPGMAESELLNISVNTDDNAILLAISLILQGYRTEAELSQLLGDISSDIRTDGILNNATLCYALINDVTYFDLNEIRNNIENKYIALGVNTVIPDFEHYINQFKDSCTYTFTNYITYPSSGSYGINILNASDSIFYNASDYNIYYSACANLPHGTHLKLKFNNGNLGYVNNSLDGWADAGLDSNNIRTWESNKVGLINLRAAFPFPGNITINIYENNSLTPTRVKHLYVQ